MPHSHAGWVGPGGPRQEQGGVLLGDMNSDDDTVQPNGDRNAYAALTAGGLQKPSTANPLGCCLNDPFLVGRTELDQRFRPPGRPRSRDTKKISS